MPEALIRFLRNLFRPIAIAVEQPRNAALLLRDLGYEFPQEIPVIGALRDTIAALSDTLAQIEALDPDADYEAYVALVPQVARTVRAVIGAIESIQASADASAPGANLGDALAELPERLIEYLLVAVLDRYHPTIGSSLRLMGLIEEESVTSTPTPFHRPYVRQRLRWDRLDQLVSDPVALAQEVYAWQSDAFAFEALVAQLAHLGTSLGVPAEIISADLPFNPGFDPAAPSVDPNLVDRLRALRVPLLPSLSAGLGLEAYPVLSANGAAIEGFGVGVYVDPNLQVETPLSDELVLRFNVEGGSISLPSILVRKGVGVALADGIFGGGGMGLTNAEVTLRYAPTGPKRVLVGIPRSTRLEVGATELHLGMASGQADPDVFVAGRLEDAALVIEAGEGDGFLHSLLPSDGLVIPFNFTAGYSSHRGFYLGGGIGLETTIGLHLELGPIALDLLHIGLRIDGGGAGLELSVTASAALGPIQAAVQRIGVLARVAFERGNLGPANLGVAFKPPNGLGLAIDAGPVSGGGYISFEPERGRYAGVLDLDVYGIGVTAIGLLDTRNEAGEPLPSPGFSFLLIISAEFQGVQLGFGFTLNGVGGLVGIHRTMALDALRSGVRDGSLDHIMFPVDPIRNMPQIISDLRAFFPVAPGRFMFGPMARIGWGTPTLFEGEIGIILEVPMPVLIALIGQVNVSLPEPDADVVSIHVSILGIVDFGKKLLSIDASLYDSHIALFAIYGDMAMRLYWGDPPNFALSHGGLNPHFQPPPEFPTLRRLTVSLGLGDNPRLSLQGYMAVTSNSIQFGAAAELYAAAGELNVYGWLKFDALVVFSPFHFRFDYSTGFALRWGQDIIAGISISGMLSGPSPYRIRGEGCISVLFFDVCIGFDVTIGERIQVELPARSPWEPLAEAIRDPRNWSAALPPGVRSAVSFRAQPDPDLLLVHPMGSVSLRQRVVPLNSRIEKFGEFRIIGPDRFDLVGVEVGARAAAHEIVTDFFAPGQFEELSNAEKLSQPSFEKMPAGVAVGSAHLAHGDSASVRVAEVGYETTIIDDPRARGRSVPRPGLSVAVQLAQGRQGARARSMLRRSGTEKYARPSARRLIQLQDEDYAIASTEDTHLRLEFGTGLTRTIARQILDAHLARHPEDRGRLQVVPLSELEAPA